VVLVFDCEYCFVLLTSSFDHFVLGPCLFDFFSFVVLAWFFQCRFIQC